MANLHLLFWLSLLPFTTGWMGENHFERWPTILYGLNLLFCAFAYLILQICTIRRQGPGSLLAEAVARDFKGKISPVLYAAGIVSAWQIRAWIGMVFFVITALMWLAPDRRMEQALAAHTNRVRDTPHACRPCVPTAASMSALGLGPGGRG